MRKASMTAVSQEVGSQREHQHHTIFCVCRHEGGPAQQPRCAGIRQAVAVLHHTHSPYLPPFQALEESTQQDAEVAADNLRFLAILEEPCTALGKAAPKVRPAVDSYATCRGAWACCQAQPERWAERLPG